MSRKNGFFSNLIDRVTLAVMSLFSGKLKKSLIAEQYSVNKEAWRDYISDKKIRFIEDQSSLTAFRYGTNKGRIGRKLFDGKEMTGADNTCEVIAVYNVLQYLNGGNSKKNDNTGASVEFPELLRAFSKKGIAYKGMFGTNPRALKKYFKEKGYEVEELKASKISPINCERFEKEYRVFVLTTFNKGQNPFSMVHTMCITAGGAEDCDVRTGDKTVRDSAELKNTVKYRLHNDYEGSKLYDSLYDAVTGYNDGKGHPVYLLAVRE